ncbi:MAG: crotonase/enoyl-CoA hydratase family protein [Paracoccaceae bacterium]
MRRAERKGQNASLGIPADLRKPNVQRSSRMDKVLYERTDRIARITLNRPDVLNAIDDEMPHLLAEAVARADADPKVHLMILSGSGKAFCAGYDLTYYAQGNGAGDVTQQMPWDPIKDYQFMWANTQAFMSLFRALKPVICKIHGPAVAGGSDIALCCDLVFMADDAEIGYMPARVWGCPTTAMWVYRLGPERAKRMLFTGDKITGRDAENMGLILKAVPSEDLDKAVEDMADRMSSVPINQLAMQKLVINQAVEATGLMNTQRLATIFDGITRHSPEGLNFKARSEDVGWKQAVDERDRGVFDWTQNRPINR